MGYLLHVVLALLTIALAEEGLQWGVEAPLAVLALACVPYLLSKLDHALVLRGRFAPAERVQRLLAVSPVVLHAVATLWLGWPASVERWIGAPAALVGWPGPSTLVALAPFVVYTLLAIDARARASDARLDEVAHARRLQVRMLTSSLAPFVLFIGLTWAIGLNRTLRANLEYVALYGGALALAMIVVAIVVLPRLLRATWDTAPMPANRIREGLESFAGAIGFRCGELVLWHTGFQVANAAVVGLGPSRVVLFSDLLLAQLPQRELIAVFAHEIGHVVRRHVIVFVAASLSYFVAIDLSLAYVAIESEWVNLALLAAAVGLWYLGFGLLSRRTELEADLFAVSVTHDVEAMIAALERVGSPHTRALGSWRHFSTEKRVEFLRRAQFEPQIAERLARGLRRFGRVALALGVVALGAEGWNLARSYREDQVRVELALGNDQRAAQRLHAMDDPPKELLRLVGVANTEPHRGAAPQVLREEADRAREHGTLQFALDLYVLAQMRGVEGLQDTIDEISEEVRTGSR